MAGYPYYGANYISPYGMNTFYPQSYQPQPVVQPQVQPMQNQQTVQPIQPQQNSAAMQPMQIQNGGFITVRSEAEARNYPVAPGTSVTFKHETAPYCYTKTMGFNQFEAPRFEKFRLVKEEDADPQQTATEDGKDINAPTYAKEEDLGKLAGVVKTMNEILNSMKVDVDGLKSDMYGVAGKRKGVKKPEATEDDA